LKLDTLVMIQTKFGFHWSSTFRGEVETCSACQDLPTLQFWSKFDYPSWSYCPFFINFFFHFNTFRLIFPKQITPTWVIRFTSKLQGR
jgi:hypothetical protein